jgi:hypothetical protein
MIMGQFAASNILKLLHWQQQQQQQLMVSPDSSMRDEMFECPDFEPMMALSVGNEAVAYTKASGVIWGKHVKDQIIGRGLGIDSEYSTLDTTSKITAHNYRMLGVSAIRAEWHAAKSFALGLPYVLEKRTTQLAGTSFKDDPKSNFGW